MKKTEAAEKVVQRLNMPSVHPHTSVSKTVITIPSAHGSQCIAQAGDLNETPAQPTKTTEPAEGENGRDTTKTDQGAVSQRPALQPEVKICNVQAVKDLQCRSELVTAYE